MEKIKLGISACLLGEKVRYDGGHKLDEFLIKTFSEFVEWVPVCPETECGLPVPREPMQLAGDLEAPRLVTIDTGMDNTDLLLGWAWKRLDQLAAENIRGFIFKSRSPSCGLKQVKVVGDTDNYYTSGVFARLFMEKFQLLPVEDNELLHDTAILEEFIRRVYPER